MRRRVWRWFNRLLVESGRGGDWRPEVGENLFVGTSESELAELPKREPLARGRRLPTRHSGGRVMEFGAVGFEGDSVASDGMLDDAEWFGGEASEVANWQSCRRVDVARYF